MNGPRLTAQVVDAAEKMVDAWKEAMEDGVITPTEMADLTAHNLEVYALSMDADEAVGLTVTMLRRGPESPSLKRRMVERGIRAREGGLADETAA